MTYQPRIGPADRRAETPGLLPRQLGQIRGEPMAHDGRQPGTWLTDSPIVVRPGGGRLPAPHHAAELALASRRDVDFAKRPTRVPSDALVPVGIRAAFAGPPRLTGPALAPTTTANDNHLPPTAAASPIAKGLREALFLIILALTMYGVFYSGRQHAFQNVIVVPGPMSFYAEVT